MIFKKKYAQYYSFAIVSLLFIILGIIKRSHLTNNLIYTPAVIIEFFEGARGRTQYLRYEFNVNEKKYTGSGWRYVNDTLEIGDSVWIVYDSINPKNNTSLRNYENPWR
jgi:hypothetical protein